MSVVDTNSSAEPSPRETGRRRRGWWIAASIVAALVLLIAAVGTTLAVAGDDDDDDEVVLVDDRVISRDRAEQLAIEAAGEGTIVELQLDDEDGRLVYEVEVQDASNPTLDRDVVIDARTGEVLGVER